MTRARPLSRLRSRLRPAPPPADGSAAAGPGAAEPAVDAPGPGGAGSGYRGPGGPLWRRWLETPPAARARSLPWLTSLLVLLVQQAGSQATAGHQSGRLPLDALARVLLTVGPLLLVLRHRHPRPVVFGTALAAVAYVAAGYAYGPVFLSVAVAAFAAIVAGHRRAAWGALLLLWAGHLVCARLLGPWLPPSGDGAGGWGVDVALATWAAVLAAAAELARTRRQEWARRRAEQRAAERRRADEERLRIARELHDVLAHSISVINVQAGVGLALLDTDREQARAALTTIRAAGKEALGEVRQVLDALRTRGDAPRAPAPGLDRLPELVAQAAGAGLEVATRTEGDPVPLPPGVDLAAFRVVQEALTNVVRHSRARTARVLLRHAPCELLVQVDDDGPPGGTGQTGGGNGLVGMRERAAALGGTAEAGPRGDGGFRVTVRLPLGAARTAPPGAPDGAPDGAAPGPAAGPPAAAPRPGRSAAGRARRPDASPEESP